MSDYAVNATYRTRSLMSLLLLAKISGSHLDRVLLLRICRCNRTSQVGQNALFQLSIR